MSKQKQKPGEIATSLQFDSFSRQDGGGSGSSEASLPGRLLEACHGTSEALSHTSPAGMDFSS